MKVHKCREVVAAVLLGFAARGMTAQARPATQGAVNLRVDNLSRPLGIDDAIPRFSWQLRDDTRGARQTAYEVEVATRPELLRTDKPDVWDSGRVDSDESMNVRYQGPAVKPSQVYYWRVKVWGVDGKPYPEVVTSQWETGLLNETGWTAPWIGFETPEEQAVRRAPSVWIVNPSASSVPRYEGDEERIFYRGRVTLDRPLRSAILYATAEQTIGAWIDGAAVMEPRSLPAWKKLPWKKFQRVDVTSQVHMGSNTLAFETINYLAGPKAPAISAPMMATLVVQYADGSWGTFSSDPSWKTSLKPEADWHAAAFDDSHWQTAARFVQPNESPDHLGNPWMPESVKALRSDFLLRSPVKSARLYATALGVYEMFLNGKRVGEDILDPGWTDYRTQVKYQTYDVTGMVSTGRNTVSALVGPGWYESGLQSPQQPNVYGDTPPALRAQLRIEHADGTVEWISTDTKWRGHVSDILSSEIYNGERQDARVLPSDWKLNNFAAKDWPQAQRIEPKAIRVEAQNFQPIRVDKVLPAISVTELKPGVYIYDFGQDMAGVERVHLQGPAGTKVQVRFAEVLNSDGSLYTDNLRTAAATDTFVLRGQGVEELTPQFTYHGFRYVELSGLATNPGKNAVEAVAFHTAAPFTAQLTTGAPMVNQLWSNILWGQRSNFESVPTDCPQRDERLGWTADAQVFWRTASYNMDLAAFSRKYTEDMRGTQAGTPFFGVYAPGVLQRSSQSGAGWSDAGVIIPWTSWLQTGDTSIIDQNWDAMERYLNAIEAANPDGLWVKKSGTPFGDWLSPEGETSVALIATAYWAYDVTLMRQMALATGRTQQAEKYGRLFETIRAAFQKNFVHPDGFVAGGDQSAGGSGKPSPTADTQTGYVLALHMNLLPENLRMAAAKKLAAKIEANHGLLGTGFLGTPYLLEELTKAGYGELAYSLLLNTQYPSWGYMVTHGATTMWERWNGDQMRDDPTMNSYNHYAYGAVADWIYRYAAGVDADPIAPGFGTIRLHPVFDARLGKLSFDYESSHGTIHSDWMVRGQSAEWHVRIPANTKGWLPLSHDEATSYRLNGVSLQTSPLVQASTTGSEQGYWLTPGSYSFTVRLLQSKQAAAN